MAKKKRRTRQRPAGVDPNEKRRQRLEENRRQREEAAKAQRRAAFRERLIRGLLIAALALAAFWFFVVRGQTPSEIGGFEVQKFREAGAGEHVNESVPYEMSPPVVGRHDPLPAACGVHGTQIQNEVFVHSLEHGAIGVLYDPAQLEEATIADIEALVSDYEDRTLSAPYAGMETPITVTSWGELMRLPDYDEAVITDYIEAFRGKGPEDQPCPNSQEQPFEPQPTPTLTPGSSPSPDGQGGGGKGGKGGKGDDG